MAWVTSSMVDTGRMETGLWESGTFSNEAIWSRRSLFSLGRVKPLTSLLKRELLSSPNSMPSSFGLDSVAPYSWAYRSSMMSMS